MGYYGMDTEQVQSVGKKVFNLEPEARTAVNNVLDSYTTASGAVHHHSVKSAMERYRETHQKGHLSLPEAVKGLGSNTANGGKAIADGNNESTYEQKTNLGGQESLLKDINKPVQ